MFDAQEEQCAKVSIDRRTITNPQFVNDPYTKLPYSRTHLGGSRQQ